MFLLAVILYLPDHILTISRRGYYYCAGGVGGTWTETSASSSSPTTLHIPAVADAAAEKVGEGASAHAASASEAVVELAGNAYQVAVNTAVAAQEAVTGMGWA
ncbi:hypothetical protein KC354_g17066 [Hortaea werneckii]|nr:hypothetical protein KC354_g17066 [Hortaea werneckii]